MSNINYGFLSGRIPAVVKSYNAIKRTCRVEIPGLTDGADTLPEAEIEYPIGDKSPNGEFTTEIEILTGELVWISFINGDTRYPIITGWRNPQTNNSVDWRRWHHKNIELLADEEIHLKVGSSEITIKPSEITIKTNALNIIGGGSTISVNGGEISMNSPQINLN